MSRYYGGDPRYSAGDLSPRDAPPRWDRDTFAREREDRYRGAPAPVQERPRPVFQERRYVEEDRYDPRGGRVEKKYFEEDDYYNDPRAAGGAMIPYRERREAPPRPGLLRRQSSLDTFDRQPNRRLGPYEDERRIPVPLPPREPSPRRYARPRMEERIYYEDVKVQEPGYDDGYREYKEREWITRRRRDGSSSRSRSRDRARSVVEEVREEEVEKPFPRRGKTRMPRRIVNITVLYDLGYPFHEEGEMIIIEKALSKENIDEVIERSRGMREERREEVTTIRIEAPVPEIREETVIQEIKTVPIEEAPRSVREWDALSVRSEAKSHRSKSSRRSHSTHTKKSRASRSHRSSSSSSSSSPSRVEESKTTIIERRPSRGGETEIIERKRIIEEGDFDESNSVHVGPLALVVDRRKSRSERDIKEEIRALEAERRHLRHERRDRDVVKIERIRDRSPSRSRAIIIEERGDEVVEVRKDRRGPPPPSPGIIKAMMATLT